MTQFISHGYYNPLRIQSCDDNGGFGDHLFLTNINSKQLFSNQHFFVIRQIIFF